MPDFRDDAELDTSQVEDLRGAGGGGRLPGGFPGGGRGMAGGGGVVALLAIAAALLFGVDITGGGGAAGGLGGLQGQTYGTPAANTTEIAQECRTGSDADEREDCRVVGYVNSIQSYWNGAFANAGERYRPAKTRFFEGAVSTGCGQASSATGPFYCPGDGYAYIDLAFFDDLKTNLGAEGGPAAQAYVLAHEYGHHVQNLTGVLGSRSARGEGADGGSVRTELMADCYAGAWFANATRTGIIQSLTEADIADVLDTAGAIGDDRIQQRTSGRVRPETFSHGTSEQRRRWFTRGYESGDPGACDTFRGAI